jgi:RNA polymerase sigma-70 factor (ECF subfamily)
MRDDGPSEVDRDTLEACRAGDPVAIRAFVTRYEGLVFAFLSRMLGRGPHIEDLAQEVFIRAYRSLPRFDLHGSARTSTWLLTVARNVAIDARRKRRLPVAPLSEDAMAVTEGTPETERTRLELGRALEQAASELSDDHREVFVLAEIHGLEMNEIATILGVPENTVKTRLFRARAHLRVLLKHQWEEE